MNAPQLSTMDLSRVLKEIYSESVTYLPEGKVANYIPALARVNPSQFGICLHTLEGTCHKVGDVETPFSIQSISKVFTVAMVYPSLGGKLWKRVGVEPSGNPFNSLVQLEYEQGKPRNPFINAGALVITDILLSKYPNDPKGNLLHFVRTLANTNEVRYDPEVAESEADTGHTNRALAHFLKSHNNLNNPVEKVLDLYFHQCSLEMTVCQLSRAFLFLANNGKIPGTQQEIMNVSQCNRLNALMLTCGFYDQAGEFAFRVGMPGKSGVGGGIAALIPEQLSMAVWSPRLNRYGNSVCGIEALERFTTKTGVSIF